MENRTCEAAPGDYACSEPATRTGKVILLSGDFDCCKSHYLQLNELKEQQDEEYQELTRKHRAELRRFFGKE